MPFVLASVLQDDDRFTNGTITELLMDKGTQLENIILLGDFNIHIEKITSLSPSS